nr:hypothetical protein [Methylomarinum sp. Ch1-1]MDP4522634.1 hypothetical protein [Methylomarinum sp. Ch1-1]
MKPFYSRKPKRFVHDALQRYSPRGLLMYFLPAALIPATIIGLAKGHVATIIINASGFAGYMLAAWCIRQGLKAEALYQQNRIARPPRWPLKLVAAVMTALTTGLIAWLGVRQPPVSALLIAGGALLGMYLSYGFDPRREKRLPALMATPVMRFFGPSKNRP